MNFLDLWHTAAITTLGLFWMAFWAFGLGYLISSMIELGIVIAVGAGTDDPAVTDLALQTLVGPVAAFFTFIALLAFAWLAGGAALAPLLAG